MYIDTHCHINFPEFSEDRCRVIDKARLQKITHIVNVGTDVSSSLESIGLAALYEPVYASAGIHPGDTVNAEPGGMDEIAASLKREKVVAVGETGLDYHYTKEFKDRQKDYFRAHIELAAKNSMPLVVHQRESAKDIMDILDSTPGPEKTVFHCFGEDEELARYCLKRGFSISFTGILTFKSASRVRDICRWYPLELIMAETDAPFLSPVPFRGKRNEPANVTRVVEAISAIKQLHAEFVMETVYNNSLLFFNLPPRKEKE